MVIDLNNIIGVRDSSQNIIERIYDSNSQIIWELDSNHEYPDDDYKNQYFTIIPDDNYFNNNSNEMWWFEIICEGTPEVYYRIDKGSWINPGTQGTANFIYGKHKIQIKCNAVWSEDVLGQYITDKISHIFVKNDSNTFEVPYTINGNIQSLIYGENFREQENIIDFAFQNIFNTGLNSINHPYGNGMTNAENLIIPDGHIGLRSFHGTFTGCNRLLKAPELPSLSLGEYCYVSMFEGCTSLIKSPLLPATDITYGAYDYMFYGCNKLKYIECYALRKDPGYYVINWLGGVPDNGTMVLKVPEDTWNQLGDDETRRRYYSWLSIPESWEILNISE